MAADDKRLERATACRTRSNSRSASVKRCCSTEQIDQFFRKTDAAVAQTDRLLIGGDRFFGLILPPCQHPLQHPTSLPVRPHGGDFASQPFRLAEPRVVRFHDLRNQPPHAELAPQGTVVSFDLLQTILDVFEGLPIAIVGDDLAEQIQDLQIVRLFAGGLLEEAPSVLAMALAELDLYELIAGRRFAGRREGGQGGFQQFFRFVEAAGLDGEPYLERNHRIAVGSGLFKLFERLFCGRSVLAALLDHRQRLPVLPDLGRLRQCLREQLHGLVDLPLTREEFGLHDIQRAAVGLAFRDLVEGLAEIVPVAFRRCETNLLQKVRPGQGKPIGGGRIAATTARSC